MRKSDMGKVFSAEKGRQRLVSNTGTSMSCNQSTGKASKGNKRRKNYQKLKGVTKEKDKLRPPNMRREQRKACPPASSTVEKRRACSLSL